MQITALVFQKNNPKRVSLSVDGKFLIGMTAELAVSLKLKVGMELNQDQVNDLVLNSLKEILLDSAYFFLSVRPRSQREIENRLKEKLAKIKLKTKEINLDSQKSEKLISDVILKLKSLGFINDEDFIKWWVSQRQEFRGKSLRAIKVELSLKGVEDKLITEVLKNYDASANDHGMAIELLTKRLPRWEGLPIAVKKDKMYRFLLQRGFEYETIKTAIDTSLQKD